MFFKERERERKKIKAKSIKGKIILKYRPTGFSIPCVPLVKISMPSYISLDSLFFIEASSENKFRISASRDDAFARIGYAGWHEQECYALSLNITFICIVLRVICHFVAGNNASKNEKKKKKCNTSYSSIFLIYKFRKTDLCFSIILCTRVLSINICMLRYNRTNHLCEFTG